jgi:hypothetical protein
LECYARSACRATRPRCVIDSVSVVATTGHLPHYPLVGVIYGDAGDDITQDGFRLYGGPGNDYLTDSHRDYAMLVGGPGSDHIDLLGDEPDDLVRVRGGGIDTVRCLGAVDRYDALYLDAVDNVQSSCRKARIVLTDRPRLPR